jgi:hypothetical protein
MKGWTIMKFSKMSPRMKKQWVKIYAGFALLLVGIILFVTLEVATITTRNTYTVEVTGKERIVSVSKEGTTSYYVVFTKTDNGEVMVFSNKDELLLGKFNSSNIQGGLEIGKKYVIDVYGFRIPLLSWYENIITYKEAE